MAKELPPGTELCGGRYVVKKTLTFEDDGGVYTAWDRESEEIRILKEILPPPGMSDEELSERVEQFQEAMLVLTQFEHPNLARVYGHFSEGRRQYVVMEKVEGIPLAQILEMAVKPLPEEQVLRWAVDLCDALHYLHDRPRPYVFEDIHPTHLLMTPEEDVKVIHYGLPRFFEREQAPRFSGSREELAREMKAFAETLVWLLTRERPSPLGVSPAQHRVSEGTARILNRLLEGDFQRIYPGYRELGKALQGVLQPPEAPEIRRRDLSERFRDVFKPPQWGRLYNEAVYAFFKQPLWQVAAEVLGVIGLIAGLWWLTHPPIHPRTAPAVYLACGPELWVVGAESRELQTRVPLETPVETVAVTPDGKKVFAASPQANRLYVVNGLSNRVLGFLPVAPAAGPMVMDSRGEWLFLLHPRIGQISVVQIDPEPLPPEPVPHYRPADRVVAVLSVGREALGLALAAEAGPDSADHREGPPARRALRLFTSSRGSRQLMVVQPLPPQEILAQAAMEDAGPLALSADGSTLYVGQPSLDHVVVLDARTLQVRGKKILKTGGTGLQQLILSPDGTELWCLSRSGDLGVINLEDRKLRATIKLPGAVRGRFLEAGPNLELWVALNRSRQVAVVNPPAREVQVKFPVGRRPSDLSFAP